MRIIASLLALFAFVSPAQAQIFSQPIERNYSVTSYDRVRVEGGLSVTMVTGVSPFARAKGRAADMDGLTIDLNGRTLVIRQSVNNRRRSEAPGPVTIEVGTPRLSQAWVNGSGTLDIDRVEGLEFDASVNGAGRLRIGALEADNFELLLNGAASAEIAGRVESGTVVVRGVSSLRGAGLDIEQLTLGVDGPGYVELGVAETAEIDSIGAGTIALDGAPACVTRLSGPTVLTGCAPGR
ncbi:DUF2807 domain-containing protein [Sphingomicrobium sp. XHP0239]|uniref:GIN domain-containing protein n=1 Tax=Sphingomicrobium maritimum TaxID=3133972 RepID=UPI0031CCD668